MPYLQLDLNEHFPAAITTLATSILVSLAAASAPAAAAEMLVNGNFETPKQTTSDQATFNIPAGSNYITGWNVVQGNVDLTTTYNYGPQENTLDPGSLQDIDLIGDTGGSGGVFGGISQSFTSVAGQLYQLTFDYSHNPGTPNASGYAAQVSISDNVLANAIFSDQIFQANGPATWVAYSAFFTATSDSTLLKFIDTQGAFNAGIYLDDVSVTPVSRTATVPEPLTLSLFGAGIAGAAALRRRKKKA